MTTSIDAIHDARPEAALRTTIDLPQRMPQARVARHDEVVWLIDRERLYGLGIGYVDAHLLAAAKLMPGTRVWTRDRQLAAACDRLGLKFRPMH